MDSPGAANSNRPTPYRQLSDPLVAWPRSAQLALAFLLGSAAALLAVHVLGCQRWGSRPTELTRDESSAYQVDLNQADHAELLQLPGVGDKLAGRIEAYRDEHGGFRSVTELTNVHGVGASTLERLRDWIRVDEYGGPESDLARGAGTQPPRSRKAASSGRTVGHKEANLVGPVDVNKATAEELQRLPGVGPRRSQLIIDERQKRPFKSVDDLRRVPGFGPKTLERLRPHVTVSADALRLAANP
jgi:competence protein ComEA